jgi:hypothetical protein
VVVVAVVVVAVVVMVVQAVVVVVMVVHVCAVLWRGTQQIVQDMYNGADTSFWFPVPVLQSRIQGA